MAALAALAAMVEEAVVVRQFQGAQGLEPQKARHDAACDCVDANAHAMDARVTLYCPLSR